jgi:tellurite resistance protein
MRSYPSWVAGLKHPAPDGTDRSAYCAGLAEGSLLNMIPEPTNKFDSNAVALHHDGKHLGYIPQRHAWVCEAIDEGRVLQCAVIEVEVTGGGIFSRRRAAHVETRISVIADVHPEIVAARAAARQEAKEQKQAEQTARAAARQHLRDRKMLEDRARKCCADGLRILAYLATVDGRRSPDEHNIEISVIESRLIASGFERDSDILAMLAEQAAALSVTKNALTRSLNALQGDESYFRLVYDAAMIVAQVDGSVDDAEAEVIRRLEEVRSAKGWF